MKLKIENLSKTYPNGQKAIDGVSIEIGVGMFGLLGPNGAGKSSLMRTLATLQLPDSGSIHFNELNVLTDKTEFRKQLGYLPQNFGVYPKQSAKSLLDYFAILKGISSKNDREHIIGAVLEITNLTDVQHKNVSDYSGGMKQRFGIAQLLLNKPKLIIVDEPTAGLDPAERHRFLNVLREVGTENVVLFSTHIVEDVTELCTDMAILKSGRIFNRATPKSAIDTLRGMVWTTTILPTELPKYKASLNIISSSYSDDNLLIIRIFATDRPNEDCTAAAPNLEDVYFLALQNGN